MPKPSPNKQFNHAWYQDELLKLGLNFHWHSYQDVGSQFDPGKFLDGLRTMGIKTVSLEAKCSMGWSYYPTKFGLRHPKLQRDYFGERARLLHDNGYRVIAYYSIGMEGPLFEKHPEYRLVNDPAMEKHPWKLDTFECTSLESPYYNEVVLPQFKELLTTYPIDYLWLDIFTPDVRWGFDRSEYAAKLFEQRMKRPLKPAGEDPDPSGTMEFFLRRAEEIRTGMCKDLEPFRARTAFGINWTFRDARREGIPTDILTGDVGGGYCGIPFELGYYARVFAATALPSDVVSTTFSHWGDWDFKAPEILEREAAIVLANGSTFWLYDCAYPEGNLETARCRRVGALAEWVREREPWFKAGDIVADVLLLRSWQAEEEAWRRSNVMVQDEIAAAGGGTVERAGQYVHELKDALIGASRFLQTNGYQFTVCSEQNLEQYLKNARMIVAPDLIAIDDAARKQLLDFVSRGGILVLAGLVEEKLASALGLQTEQVDGYGRCYLRCHKGFEVPGVEDLPIAVKAPRVALTMQNAEVLMDCLPVAHERQLLAGVPYTWGYPKPDEERVFVGMAKSTFGEGQILAISPRVFNAGHKEPLKWFEVCLKCAIERCGFVPEFRLATDDPVEIVHRISENNEGKEWLHLIQIPEERYTSVPLSRLPVLRDLVVQGQGAFPDSVKQMPEGKRLQVQAKAAGWQVVIPELRSHVILEVERR